MSDIVATVAVVLGTVFGVLSAVGIVRMPDVYIRLQVASKASSLGIALLMLGVAVHFGELDVTVRALLVVVFLFLTAPVAAHVIGRAAYITRTPLAAGTDPDELAGRYDSRSGPAWQAWRPTRRRRRPPTTTPGVARGHSRTSSGSRSGSSIRPRSAVPPFESMPVTVMREMHEVIDRTHVLGEQADDDARRERGRHTVERRVHQHRQAQDGLDAQCTWRT